MTWLARAAIKAQLDELMGKDRDVPLNAKKKTEHWSDPEFCHFFLVRFCPHDLFKNTKSDLGPCTKVHEDRVQKLLQDEGDIGATYTYSLELLRFLEDMVVKLDRQIERAQDRVMAPKANLNPQQAARVADIETEIKRLQQVMSDLDESAVQQCMEMMSTINNLTQEKEALESGDPLPKMYGGEKQQSVCVICGAISQSTDNDARLVAHLEGKQHMGFLKIRVTIDQLKTYIDETRSSHPSVTQWRPPPKEGADTSTSAPAASDDRRDSSSSSYNNGGGRSRDDRYSSSRDSRGGGGRYEDSRGGGGGGYRGGGGGGDYRGGGGGSSSRYDDRSSSSSSRYNDDRRGGGGGGGRSSYDDRDRDRSSSSRRDDGGSGGYRGRGGGDDHRREDRPRERDRSPERGARDSRRERDRSPSDRR